MKENKFSPETNKGRAIAQLQSMSTRTSTFLTKATAFNLGDYSLIDPLNPVIISASDLEAWIGAGHTPGGEDELVFDPRFCTLLDVQVIHRNGYISPDHDHIFDLFDGQGNVNNQGTYGFTHLDFNYSGPLVLDLRRAAYIEVEGSAQIKVAHGLPLNLENPHGALLRLAAPGFAESGDNNISRSSISFSIMDEETIQLGIDVATLEEHISSGRTRMFKNFVVGKLIGGSNYTGYEVNIKWTWDPKSKYLYQALYTDG